MLTVMLTLQGLLISTTEDGVFVVKVLVSDGKDYVTKEWLVTVEQEVGGFSITGSAVSIVSKGSGSLLSWLKRL